MGEKSNLEIVQLLYDSFRARDNDTAFEYLDPEIVWTGDITGLLDLDDEYRGHEGIRRFWRQWLSAWEEISWEMQLEKLQDGRIRALIHQRNKGRGTGIWVDQRPYVQYWTLAGGKVVRMEMRWVDEE